MMRELRQSRSEKTRRRELQRISFTDVSSCNYSHETITLEGATWALEASCRDRQSSAGSVCMVVKLGIGCAVVAETCGWLPSPHPRSTSHHSRSQRPHRSHCKRPTPYLINSIFQVESKLGTVTCRFAPFTLCSCTMHLQPVLMLSYTSSSMLLMQTSAL